eukprot:129348-Pyramimonas_sp.AAC.1
MFQAGKICVEAWEPRAPPYNSSRCAPACPASDTRPVRLCVPESLPASACRNPAPRSWREKSATRTG